MMLLTLFVDFRSPPSHGNAKHMKRLNLAKPRNENGVIYDLVKNMSSETYSNSKQKLLYETIQTLTSASGHGDGHRHSFLEPKTPFSSEFHPPQMKYRQKWENQA